MELFELFNSQRLTKAEKSNRQIGRIDKERNIFETVANGWISSKILKDMTCNTTTNLTNNCVTIAWK